MNIEIPEGKSEESKSTRLIYRETTLTQTLDKKRRHVLSFKQVERQVLLYDTSHKYGNTS